MKTFRRIVGYISLLLCCLSVSGQETDSVLNMSPLEVDDFYSCVVFIETFPEDKIPTDAGKGVRKTWLEGYSQVKEFYNPDYSILPSEPDYRRRNNLSERTF